MTSPTKPVAGLLRIGIALAILQTPAAADAAPRSPDSPSTLTVLFTNDLKGQLRPYPYFGESRGGMARLVRLLRELDPRGDALILDGGDALGPDPMAQFDAGRLFAGLMDRAGYDAMVPGNHGLNYGIDTLRTRQREVSFPFVAANLVDADSGEPLLTPAVIVDRAGLRVLVTGVLPMAAKRVINPVTTADVDITDPGNALQELLAVHQRGRDFDYAVVLAHMRPLQALQLAQKVSGIDLFIAGDNPTGDAEGGAIELVRLVSGAYVVSCPHAGAFVGRVDIEFGVGATSGDSAFVVKSTVSRLIPLSASLPEDSEARRRIEAQEAAYEKRGRRVIGTITEKIVDSPQFVCELMRQTLETEVGILNMGALRPVELAGPVRVAQIDSLLRFDDRPVALKLTGKKLLGMAGSSRQRPRGGQRLVFSGFDPAAEKVGGIAIQKEEKYTVATTRYLASGGDDYIEPSAMADATVHASELGQLVSRFLATHSEPLRALTRNRGGGSSWKTQTQFTNSLSLTTLNEDAGLYKGVSSISGRDAMAWNAVMNARSSRTTARGALALDVKSSFGQLREQDRFTEAADRLDADLVYSLQRRQPAPFVAAAINTVWTAPSGDERPLTLRGSAGVHSILAESLNARFGLALERDFVEETNQVGLEVVPEYRRRLAGGNALNSKAKLFMSATESRKVSLQQFNSLVINFSGDLHITVDANFFFHWDNQVSEPALKSELQIGFGYVWDGKWVR